MSRHRPNGTARREADAAAKRIGSEIETSRRAIAASIETTARRAGVAPSTVVRVLHGDGGAHLDTLYAVATAVGLRPSIKLYPSKPPSLRDTGQLHIAQYLMSQAHPSLKPMLELPVADPFGRAVDLVFIGRTEIVACEIERSPADFQASKRRAALKRDALQAIHQRPVRLVLAIEDTRRNRELLAPYAELIRADLPATPATVMRRLRSGEPLGQDGILWVRPWRRLLSTASAR
jgi:transcriptional regulator with XRE-family HTH domain